MAWPPWPKGNEKDLAKYVLPSVAGRVKLSAVREDLLKLGKRRELLEEIYKALLKYDIRYAREPFDSTLEQQRIRTPAEILKGAGDATCLDLALLFAGLCLGNQLLPLVVVLDGHALVAISLMIGRDEANAQRRRDEDQDGPWVGEGLLRMGDTLRELVGRGDYLLIECTGFARSETISATVPEGRGRVGGRIEFDRAVDAGREQLDAKGREFVFAIDVAMLQDHIKVPPYDPGSDFTAIPAQAPAIRSGYIPRPEVLAGLKAHLAPTGALKVVALHGMPGSGKSVMAAAVVADEEWTSANFPDGVLWASVGLSPDLTSILSGWIQALGGSDLRFTEPGAAKYALQSLLSYRAVLIIIDDVWEAAHGSSLVVGGSRCSVLVTTREAAVARACQVPPDDILPMPPTMTKEQARTLLAGGSHSLPEAFLTIADDVASAVGRLPLALQLAAAQAADGVPWQEIRDNLQIEMARLETLDLPGADELEDPHLARQQSLLASLSISFRRLPADRRRRLVQLGVLRSGSVVLPAAAAVLWAVDERAARDGLRYLNGRALLDPWGSTGFKLHNTVHALARRLITAPVEPPPEARLGMSGLGMTQTAAHAELVNRYAATRVNGQWHSLADDGYIHRNLVWHMERAERLDELHALLQEATTEGTNAWFSVREHLGQPEGFFDDVRRAFALSMGEWCIRYALILSSLRFVANVPPELVQELIRAARWSVPFAATYGRNIADVGKRALTLAAIAKRADGDERRDLLKEAMTAAETLDEDADTTISSLAPQLAATGLISEALVLARRLEGQPLASVLADIVSVAPAPERPAILSEAMEAAKACGPLFRSGALASLVPNLDEAQVRELLSDCEKIHSQALREAAISVLLPRLGELGFHDEALAIARSLSCPPPRATSLASIALAASEPARTETIREVLTFLPEIDDEAWAKKLSGEVPQLSPAVRSLLEFTISRESLLAEILASLPPDLAPELRKQAIEVIDARKDSLEVARTVAALAPRLGDDEREVTVHRATERARAELDPGSRAPALAALIDAYPTEQRAAVAREVLEATEGQFVLDMEDVLRKVGPYLDETDQFRALTSVARVDAESRQSRLAALAPFLSPALLPRAIAIARTIDDDEAALLVGAALAPQLDADDLRALMDWMPRVANDYVLARAVAAVLPHLTEAALPAARTVIEGITWDTSLAQVALPALAARLTGPERNATLKKAVEVAAAMDDPDRLVWAFQAFVSQLSARQIKDVVEILDTSLVRQSEYPECRVQLLAAAAAHAGKKLRPSLVSRAFALVKQLTDDEKRSEALCALAEVLDDDERATAMTHADDIANAFEKAEVYAALAATALEPQNAHDMAMLAVQQVEYFMESQVFSTNEQAEIIGSRALPYVSPSAQKEALNLIASFDDRALSARALANITPRLASELLPRAIEIAGGYPAADRTAPLAALAARTATASRAALLGQALDSALEEHTDLLNDDTLAPIAQPLAELPLAELTPLWRRALNAISNRPRPTALASLRSLVPVLLRVEGRNGARHCLRALRDVRRWWP